ncbi:hypothetical protein F4777DRAFT_595490 [Nemania sp. FL0916]|nr:hypothetical protein F4777DRAFT_595490 [Nemania sp. FL0916]
MKASDYNIAKLYHRNNEDNAFMNRRDLRLGWSVTSQAERMSPPPLILSDDDDNSVRQLFNPQLSKRRTRKQRRRYGLPIIISSDTDAVQIMTCPDSGSDENIISLELVNRLGLKIHDSGREIREFSLANGKIIEAVGQVTAQCSFGAGPPSDVSILDCIFHVFQSLAVPVIIGMQFLEQTETLSKHRDRLVEQIIPSMQALRVNSVGKPRKHLICRLDTHVGCASADTGSDLDLISLGFARSRAFNIEPGLEQLEFADCSLGYTSGVIKASFSVGNLSDVNGFSPYGGVVDLEFYILEGLNTDILVGQDTIDELDVFSLHTEFFIPSISKLGESDVNIIRHIGTVERFASNFMNKVKDKTLSVISRQNTESPIDFAAELSLEDQRENARREAAWSEIKKLTGLTKLRAEDDEAARILKFEERRKSRLKSNSTSAAIANSAGGTSADNTTRSQDDTFVCTFQSCTEKFQTQYLLNAHATVHSSERPHFCPVRGCPRDRKGDKGFKQRSGVVRHYEFYHVLLKYACPFCSSSKRGYTRRDHLKHHVRRYHADKDVNDPVLQEVLGGY